MRIEDLIGSKVVVSVGEPWDFDSEDGQNVLFGEITAASEPYIPVRDQRVEVAVTPFTARDGSNVDYLVAVSRYQDDVGIVEYLLAGSAIEVNLHYDEQVQLQNMPEGSSPFLIGGVHLRFHDHQDPRGKPSALTLHQRGTLAKDLPDQGLRAGDTGAVVHVYAGEVAYEVEFISADGETSAVVSVGAGNLLPTR